jgi:hypothetical protein
MSSRTNLDRYRGENRLRKFVTDYKPLVMVASFLVVVSVIALGFDTLGYPEIAGMLISWNVLVTGVLFVFAVVPLYLIRFLPSYHKF